MDGSDLPPEGSSQRTPKSLPGSRKSKRGDDASPVTPAGAGSSSTTTARRSRRLAGAPPDAPAAGSGTSYPSPSRTKTARRSKGLAGRTVGAVADNNCERGDDLGRFDVDAERGRGGAGELWKATSGSGSGSGHADKEMREAILRVRLERSVLAPDDAASSYRELGLDPDMASKLGLLRSAAAGGDLADVEQKQIPEVFLSVRRERSVLAPDDASSSYRELGLDPDMASKLGLLRSAAAGGDLADVEQKQMPEKQIPEVFLSVRRERSVLAPDDASSSYRELGLDPDMASKLGLLRSAAAGGDLADVEQKQMPEVFLRVRRERSVLAPDDAASSYRELGLVPDMASKLGLLRSAAAGGDLADVEQKQMPEVFLRVRRERSVLAPDDAASSYRELGLDPDMASKLGLLRSAAAGGDLADVEQKQMPEVFLRVRRERSVLAPDDAASSHRELGLDPDMDSQLGILRRAGAGGHLADVEQKQMPEVFLSVRRVRSIMFCFLFHCFSGLSIGDCSTNRICRNLGYCTSVLFWQSASRKGILIDPILCQASVPEWRNALPEKDIADYTTDGETSRKLGQVVCPLNMDSMSTSQLSATSSECKCKLPGSKACVGVHIKMATSLLKNQLGEHAFSNCGLEAMGGEQTLKLWTRTDQKKIGKITRVIPRNKRGNFMEIALKKFSSEKPKKDLVNYYYNVFLPRRLASLTRAENTNAKDVDTDGDSDEDHSEKKMKTLASSIRLISLGLHNDISVCNCKFPEKTSLIMSLWFLSGK
uniref:ELM2 domain-containing protein n=1 Tax=Oryza brachyantha TaxID=4533 RepID=J3LUC5_ORYBR